VVLRRQERRGTKAAGEGRGEGGLMKQKRRSGGAYVADGLADEGAVGHELACGRLVVSDSSKSSSKTGKAAVKQQQQESVLDALAVDAEENGLAAEQ
jgi:hypothetical protein